MFEGIPIAIASIRASLDIFKAIKDINKQAEVNNAVIEITMRLNEILNENTRLIELLNQKEKSISVLEKTQSEYAKKNSDKEKWELDCLDYEAWNPMVGTMLYRKKPKDGVVKNSTNFCAKCYEPGKASVLSLQSVKTMPGIGPFIATLVCHICNSTFLAPSRKLKDSQIPLVE